MVAVRDTISLHDVSKLNTPEKRWNPYDWYESMLNKQRVYYDEQQDVWSIFRYEDVQYALKEYTLFSNRRKRSVIPVIKKDSRVSMNTVDPPLHRDVRHLVSRAFSPHSLSDWRPRIQRIVDQLISAMHTKAEIDLVQDFAIPLPITIISDLLGAPREDTQTIKKWSDALFLPNVSYQKEQQQKEKLAVMAQFEQYLLPLIKAKRQQPTQDIISDLTTVAYEGDTLTDEEIAQFSISLLAAGNETTTNLITNLFYCLLYDAPSSYETLRCKPSLCSQAIEETLRFRFPITLDREVTEDTTIFGTPMKKGDIILLWISAANHDPLVFPSPHVFDLTRSNSNKHLTFGKGPHFCLGAPLARLEATLALETFLRHVTHIQPLPAYNVQEHIAPDGQNLASLPIMVTWN
ncbi:cytochrome P450 [Fictibacillus macauensis ZFHKF-1]|uniref:Cytochrome P450 n=1 Tax=Fictibacillus macauensis ZFHKF-1 TaxID=1196324 RepID=I8UB00_9BACL|nr:cytochrome P450 [Fictibacillus macauensis]EIT84105.1 cytochrome P450 [Fictibacillus macauensis ZFHKF-1]